MRGRARAHVHTRSDIFMHIRLHLCLIAIIVLTDLRRTFYAILTEN